MLRNRLKLRPFLVTFLFCCVDIYLNKLVIAQICDVDDYYVGIIMHLVQLDWDCQPVPTNMWSHRAAEGGWMGLWLGVIHVNSWVYGSFGKWIRQPWSPLMSTADEGKRTCLWQRKTELDLVGDSYIINGRKLSLTRGIVFGRILLWNIIRYKNFGMYFAFIR